jgi:hypothetical protein
MAAVLARSVAHQRRGGGDAGHARALYRQMKERSMPCSWTTPMRLRSTAATSARSPGGLPGCGAGAQPDERRHRRPGARLRRSGRTPRLCSASGRAIPRPRNGGRWKPSWSRAACTAMNARSPSSKRCSISSATRCSRGWDCLVLAVALPLAAAGRRQPAAVVGSAAAGDHRPGLGAAATEMISRGADAPRARSGAAGCSSSRAR